ncbi:MAG: PD-(D/E)XK nuclease family protein, partial [Clostridia bacterium]|nr:PD-(D/E)XK nuclease family protein [Clostridia bacterium]
EAARLLLLTPDQYTLQAELELTEQLKLPGLLRMEVLSPSRLTERVFQLTGSPSRVRIDGRGKSMLLADIIRQAKGKLSYYRNAAGRRGFVERLSACIGDFKKAGMTPDEVRNLAQTMDDGAALRDKLLDIAMLFERYQERLQGAFLDGEDVQEAMLDRLPASGVVTGAHVWIYGFDLLSPQFTRQIAAMAREAFSLRVALTLESEPARDAGVFAPSRETLARLGRFLDSERLLWTHEPVRTALPSSPEIAHLETELFAVPQSRYPCQPANITLWAASDPYDEAMRVAAEMRAFAAKDGVRFDEMAVVACDLEGYTGAIESAFSRSGVPFHLARKRPALWHPLLRAWLAALRCGTRGWRSEDAIDWIKSGFAGIDRTEAELLENYALENGLRGKKWLKPIEDLSLEAVRARFAEPMLALQEGLRGAANATETLTAAYSVLADVNAYAALAGLESELQALGRREEAADCAQAWRLMLETLDQLHALLGESRLPMSGIAEVIESGLLSAELGAVPQQPGTAQVGQLGHIKIGGKCRILFLLGMQDGVLNASAQSLLSDREIEKAGNPAAFGLRGDTLSQMMQINLLDTLAAPTEKLFISHSLAGVDGSAQRPAAVLTLIKRLFPDIKEYSGLSHEEIKWHAPGAALDALGDTLREALDRGKALTEDARNAAVWLLRNGATHEAAMRVTAALTADQTVQPLPKAAARMLFGKAQASVTRLETFAHCPYWHFISYGLRPAERREPTPKGLEIGTFYHRAMEKFTAMATSHARWPDISRATCNEMMDEALAPLRAQWTLLSEDAMLRAIGDGFCRIARRAAWTYTDQIRRGQFQTKVFEARFGIGEALPPVPLVLPDGERRFLEGRIDRIDFYEEDGERWLRVVDYKSGETSLDPAKMYGGLQLQLLLYLMAALAAFDSVKPAGAFYSRLDDPLILTDSRDIDQIERKIAREMRLGGLLVSDPNVVRAMEDGDALLKRDGTPRQDANTASAEQLAALMRHAHALAAEMSGQILDGDIRKRPAQKTGFQACDRCHCRAACAFDEKTAGKQGRKLERMNLDEMLERVETEREGGR